MPCKDVTELLQLTLDDQDRLRDYRFIKRTCGQGVGVDCLLLDDLKGKSCAEIAAIEPLPYVEHIKPGEPIEEFLVLKHLIALQSALEVLTGVESGAADAPCAASEVSYEGDELVLQVRLRVDVVTERIRSCGGCGDCGSKKAEAAATSFG